MSSETEARFKAMPPIRTSTADTMGSSSSDAMSPSSDAALSPTSTLGRGRISPTCPTETKFFDAISTKIRQGRSRSRSRSGKSPHRSKSPMMMPPQQLSSSSDAQSLRSPTQEHPRPQPRHASSASQGSITATPEGRPAAGRRTSSDHWRGRHSNSWLFNDFSLTEATKKALKRKP